MKIKIRHLVILTVIATLSVLFFISTGTDFVLSEAQQVDPQSNDKPGTVGQDPGASVKASGYQPSSTNLAEEWPIEINYIDAESVSEDEMLSEQQIAALELLEQEMPEIGEEEERMIAEMTGQLAEFFIAYEQDGVQIMDLDCIHFACRATVQFTDQTVQDRVLSTMQNQMDWLKKSYADVQLLPDDSRIAMLLLLKK